MPEKEDKNLIPKLELEKFTFSPPGPMGWSFSEYEKILDDPEAIQEKQYTGLNNFQEIFSAQVIEYPSTNNFSHSFKENKVKTAKQDEETSNFIKEEEIELTKATDIKEFSEEYLDENLEEEVPVIEEIPLPRVRIIIDDRSKSTPFLTHLVKNKSRVRV
ncbi:hypothetical protein PB1_02360 [Bacillus methanolicus PB1]|uniref:Uncharacterized protein n=1 Tax=Bacillus methanolicus PB1 TaxID=997296 RepID=I3E5H4_BACMT|nr:hypothetical protein [Bacillus methanolicus]EIJ81745.1 hypothetical protein PB1_02360 [Bacillus methanolicus PB1]